jgi:hypothetical protein
MRHPWGTKAASYPVMLQKMTDLAYNKLVVVWSRIREIEAVLHGPLNKAPVKA